ncbi:MAG TPA: hypothetical protein VFT90_13360 [Chryseosolibacter sp.]|nr:hypothetical protein [Chryseosolibacter sp.]
MALIVAVSSAADSAPLTIPAGILSICKSVVNTETHVYYTPLPGRLVELLTYFNEVGLTYELRDDTVYS